MLDISIDKSLLKSHAEAQVLGGKRGWHIWRAFPHLYAAQGHSTGHGQQGLDG